MEEIKLQIAKRDGFNSWEMMLRCYSTTDAGLKIIDKYTKEVLRLTNDNPTKK